jgi:UDP-N-acetylmuramyl pentapeptide phosphotransferase/UDP-N-acetylglucosamine-1-phosphate transferase
MSFILFVLLFTVLCGWLDARIDVSQGKDVK